MAAVGVRDLKNRLSHYLRRVRSGERLVITERGKPIAVIAPSSVTHEDARIAEMLRDRVAHWAGGKPRGLRRPPRIKGSSVADAVIEDRR